MARVTLTLDYESFGRLAKVIEENPANAENIINDVLWEHGGQYINDAIMQLLPRSGRTWAGKKKAARDTAPFTQENGNLSVAVKTKYAYHYLYFPDDGTDTKNHAGEQHFMFQGAWNEKEKIMDLCIARLLENFKEV